MTTALEWKTDPRMLQGANLKAAPENFGEIDYRDHQIAFYVDGVEGKDVLDLGCIDHDPENHRSRFWLHRAFMERAGSVIGVDLYEAGVKSLQKKGYNVITGDVQVLRLGRQFDVVAAGGLITHLEDLHGFMETCKAHMKPDARLLITVPNPWYWRTFLRAAVLKEACANPEQMNWICPRSMRQLGDRHGFVIKKMAFGSRYLRDRLTPLPKGWRSTSIHFLLTRLQQALLLPFIFSADTLVAFGL